MEQLNVSILHLVDGRKFIVSQGGTLLDQTTEGTFQNWIERATVHCEAIAIILDTLPRAEVHLRGGITGVIPWHRIQSYAYQS